MSQSQFSLLKQLPNDINNHLTLYGHTISLIQPDSTSLSHSQNNLSIYALFGKISWYAGSETNTLHLYENNTWTSQVTPLPKRAFHTTVIRYDRETDSEELVVFGGMRTLSREEKRTSLTPRTPLSESPSRVAHQRSNSRTFDALTETSRSRTGSNASPTTSTDNIIYGDMWIYNIRQKTWFEIEYEPDSLLPAPRYGHSAVYSRTLDAMFVLCGTLNMQEINEDFEDVDFDLGNNMEREHLRKEAHKATLWRFDFTTNRWTRIVFPFWDFKRVSIQNLVRSNFVMILRPDEQTQRESLLICFGADDNEHDNEREFYTFDLKLQNRWARHLTTGAVPSLRDGIQYLYSEQDDCLVVYGGVAKSSGTKFTPDNNMFVLDIQASQWIDISSQFLQLQKQKRESSKKMHVQTGRASVLGRTSQLNNQGNMESPYPTDMEPRGYAGACLLPRASPVHPWRFYVHNGLGEDRAILQTSFYFELNYLRSVSQEEFVPSSDVLLRDLQALYMKRSQHSDVTFQFPFPLESIHAHSIIVNQSPVIARWLSKAKPNKQGKLIVDITQDFSHYQFGVVVQLMYGAYVASDDWEASGIMAELLQLPDIVEYCKLKQQAQSSHLMNEQPMFNRASTLISHLKKQVPASVKASSMKDAVVQIKTLDTHLLHFHRALCMHRCPQYEMRFQSVLSRLDKSVVSSIQDYVYGQRSRLPFGTSNEKKRIEHLLNLACASHLLHLWDLEEQCLCHLKRSVTSSLNAQRILTVCNTNRIVELYGGQGHENAEYWNDLCELCRLVLKNKGPSLKNTPQDALFIAKVLIDEEFRKN